METSTIKSKSYSGINLMIILLILFYLCLAILFKASVTNSHETLTEILILLFALLFIIKGIDLIKRNILRIVLQASFVFSFFAYFFGLSSKFQFILHTQWQDAKLIELDRIFFGNELSLILEKFTTPYLTEAMMFAYVFYLPLLVITAILIFKSAGDNGLEEYLFMLSLSYAFCYIGFILFPVASQMYFMPEKYSIPIEGGFFTYLSELIRHNLHYPGGSLPSPHCAAATVILWACYKNSRKIFFVILPSIMLLYISTVYGRFHYFIDSLTGILTGYMAILLYPLMIKFFNLLKTFFNCILNPVSIINSLGE
jgi:membrane-associated phospholipid phosphatase